MMKEKLRKYKSRTQALEQQVAQRSNQLQALEATLATLKQQLEVCAVWGCCRRGCTHAIGWRGAGARGL